ncbi:MAG: DegT/DnrJ/EryC1/StrS family aminotransferase [Proteobacteria bacterium]|jgi:dTDP-4-amino-4,6-dideoxygalactose transaminase|nr:DegT/DnrJ/EryC1/StrS family aminotransferase [Pseudomonadota bacterium]
MIPFLDLTRQHGPIEAELNRAMSDVLRSGQYVMGHHGQSLAADLASYCGCTHGIGVASGTDALRLTLQAMGVGPGDEVLTTPFTFIATVNTISRCGARPVFVDIEPSTFNIDPTKLQAAITDKTKAIVVVHLFGHPAKMDQICNIAKQVSIPVIEDAAQALGARWAGRPVGSFGEAACLSFFPTKNLGGVGDGGMVVTSSAELADGIDVLRRHGSRKRNIADVIGFNSRLDELQATVLKVKLPFLDEWNRERRLIASRYDELLRYLPVHRPYVEPRATHVFHQYTIRVERHRDELRQHLQKAGVPSMVYYPMAIHEQPPYRKDVQQPLVEAEHACRQVLSLPIFPGLQVEEQHQVVNAIKTFFAAP